MMRLVLIVDATQLVTRQFCSRGEWSPAAVLVGAVYGFTAKHSCDAVEIVFDGGGETFRHRAFSGYKASRKPKDKSLLECMDDAKAMSADYGTVRCVPGVEADDVIATLSARYVSQLYRVVVFSVDKDFLTLLQDDAVTILQSARKERGQWLHGYFTAAMFRERVPGVEPHQWPEVRAMAGDASDEWPGANGVGEKTAAALVAAFGTIEKIITALRDWPHSLELTRAGVKLSKRQVDGIRNLDLALARRITYLKSDVDIPEPERAVNVE